MRIRLVQRELSRPAHRSINANNVGCMNRRAQSFALNPALSTKLAASTTMTIGVSAKACAKLDDEVGEKGGSGDSDGSEDEDGGTKAWDATTTAAAKVKLVVTWW